MLKTTKRREGKVMGILTSQLDGFWDWILELLKRKS